MEGHSSRDGIKCDMYLGIRVYFDGAFRFISFGYHSWGIMLKLIIFARYSACASSFGSGEVFGSRGISSKGASTNSAEEISLLCDFFAIKP